LRFEVIMLLCVWRILAKKKQNKTKKKPEQTHETAFISLYHHYQIWFV